MTSHSTFRFMKIRMHTLTPLLGFVLAFPVARAAEEAGKTKQKEPDKPELRVISGPRGRDHVFMAREGEKEAVTFLGVETSPVSATLSTQLNLPRGSGLVVNHIIEKSPADGVLHEHDILLKLDDQLLIETRQLAVLIRNHKEGDEVSLTLVRGGQQSTAKVKLGKHEVPKATMLFERAVPGSRPFFYSFGPEDRRFELAVPGPDAPETREEMDRVLSLLRRAPGAPDAPDGAIPPPARIHIDHSGGPGVRAISVNTGNSNIAYSDDDGSLDLTMKDGVKTLVAKDPKGTQIFSGPVTTPEERKAMPLEVRERLERLEGMHNMTFHTDADFQGAETKIMRPLGRGIALPHYETPRPRPSPVF
jgi:hypothetical protein